MPADSVRRHRAQGIALDHETTKLSLEILGEVKSIAMHQRQGRQMLAWGVAGFVDEVVRGD